MISNYDQVSITLSHKENKLALSHEKEFTTKFCFKKNLSNGSVLFV